MRMSLGGIYLIINKLIKTSLSLLSLSTNYNYTRLFKNFLLLIKKSLIEMTLLHIYIEGKEKKQQLKNKNLL